MILSYVYIYCVGNNLIKTTHFILELDREEEPLLGDEAVDFCADNDTFHVSMTRSQDGGDCDQWCSSLESEEECSGACHAITGKYLMSVCCFKSDEWSIHYLLSFIVQGRLVTGGLVRVRSPTPPSPQSRPWCTATAPAPHTRPPALTPSVTPWSASTPASVPRYHHHFIIIITTDHYHHHHM